MLPRTGQRRGTPRCAETLFYDYYRQHNLKIRVARIFNLRPKNAPNDGRVISNFILQVLKNEPITIYGDGSQTRSFCFVDDLIEGLVLLLNFSADLPEPVNLGNPVEITIKEVAEEIISLIGSRFRLEYRPLPADDPRQRCPEISRARERLNWQTRVPLKAGLERTIAYFDGVLARELQEERKGSVTERRLRRSTF